MVNNCNPETGVSICIPRVFNNIGWRRIKQVMISCNWGYVERVDVISCGKYKRAFVHFTPGKWNKRSPEATRVLESLKNGDEVHVIYENDKPWYWKIRASGSKKTTDAPKRRKSPSVRFEKQTFNPPIMDYEDYEVDAQNDGEFRHYEIKSEKSIKKEVTQTNDTKETEETKVSAYDNINSMPEYEHI